MYRLFLVIGEWVAASWRESTWQDRFTWATVALGFWLLGTVSIWMFAPYNIITTDDTELMVYTEDIYPGATIEYGLKSFCITTDRYTAVVTRMLLDGSIVATQPVTLNLPKNCYEGLRMRMQLPWSLTPGEPWRLTELQEFPVNPLRTKRYLWSSPKFLVHKRPPHQSPSAD